MVILSYLWTQLDESFPKAEMWRVQSLYYRHPNYYWEALWFVKGYAVFLLSKFYQKYYFIFVQRRSWKLFFSVLTAVKSKEGWLVTAMCEELTRCHTRKLLEKSMNFLIVPLLAKIEKEIDSFLEEFLKANKFWVQN